MLNNLFLARSQMGMSLAFHIIFAVIGMAMPPLMAVSEGCYLWTRPCDRAQGGLIRR